MKCVLSSSASAELALLKNILQNAGIRCIELNEQMAQTIPLAPFQAELWVENEADYAPALALLAEWHHPTHTGGPAWKCSQCGETLGSQFSKCWKCGQRRAASA
ncbi:MAG: DUF2007 domain-containing protein [Verrucomicrobiales bacterium]|nr:DUF2007 domain-containing protein [Verrucomicrobiales bacterium]